jgi:ABC-type sugar transport system, periplasmic component
VSPRPWRLITALAITAAATACTAGNQSPADSGPKAEAPQTIEVWHGWSAPHEVKAFEDAIAGFHKLHPNITVKLVKGQDDDKILNAIRSGTRRTWCPPSPPTTSGSSVPAAPCRTSRRT